MLLLRIGFPPSFGLLFEYLFILPPRLYYMAICVFALLHVYGCRFPHQDGMCPCGEQAPSKESVQLASGGSGFSGGAAETMAVKVTEAFRA